MSYCLKFLWFEHNVQILIYQKMYIMFKHYGSSNSLPKPHGFIARAILAQIRI